MKQIGKITKAQKKKTYGTVKNYEKFRALEHRRIIENDRKRRGRNLNRELNGGDNETSTEQKDV